LLLPLVLAVDGVLASSGISAWNVGKKKEVHRLSSN
jgi:hypothetical protein